MNSKCDYSIHRIAQGRRGGGALPIAPGNVVVGGGGGGTELWVIPCRHVLISKQIH